MYVQADKDLAQSTQLNAEYSGTTACMAMVHNGCVYVANVGDSGACLGRLGPNGRIQAVEISKYARPSDPQVIASSPQPTCKQTSSQASVLYARVWLAVLSGLLAF